jgi:hypothetical protein
LEICCHLFEAGTYLLSRGRSRESAPSPTSSIGDSPNSPEASKDCIHLKLCSVLNAILSSRFCVVVLLQHCACKKKEYTRFIDRCGLSAL